MARALALLLCSGASVLLLAAPADARRAPVVRSVESGVVTVAGEPATLTVACPRNSLAVSGAATSTPDGFGARSSSPLGLHRWRFSFRAARENGTAEAAVRCVRLRIPGGYTAGWRVETVNERFVIGAGSTRSGTLGCRRGFLPTGYGWKTPEGSREHTLLSRVSPGPRRLEVSLRNLGGATDSLTVYARCLERTSRARRPGRRLSHRFKLRRASARRSAEPGSSSVTERCRRGYASLSTGYSLGSAEGTVPGTGHAQGRREGRWEFVNFATYSVPVRTYLTCLSLRTRYRARG